MDLLTGEFKEPEFNPRAQPGDKDDFKQQQHAMGGGFSAAAQPMPSIAAYPGAGIEPSFQSFISVAPAGGSDSTAAPVSTSASIVPGSTLPSFDAFGTSDYRTPFDSPDPVLNMAQKQQPVEPAPELSVLDMSGAPAVQPPRLRAKSYTAPHTPRVDASSSSQKAPLKHAASTRASKRPGASSAFPPSALDVSDVPDVVFSGVIPEIVSTGALQNRRASEPVETLGSRRAAEAAKAAAAARAQQAEGKDQSPPLKSTTAATSSTTAASSAPASPLGVPRRLSIKTDTLDTAKASNINLDPLSLRSPVTPRRQCESCTEPAFAADLCAAHLTQRAQGGNTTPTSVIRKVHQLWSRTVAIKNSSTQARLQLTWKFWKKAEHYVVALWEDDTTGERTVMVNGKVNYRSRPSSGFWKLSMVLGRSKSSAFEVLIEATPRSQLKGTGSVNLYPGAYEFEIWIEGFPFVEAQNNFLSELGAAQQIAMMQKESDLAGGLDSLGRNAAKAAHYDALHYIQTHWSRHQSQSKTRLGYTKNEVTWRFTIKGTPHTLILAHSERSGKRTITLDNKLLFVHTPNIINGLLLQRSSTQKLEVDGTAIEVRLQRMEYSSVHGMTSLSAATHPPFQYDLSIGGIPFAKCMKTLPEYAGGMVDVEATVEKQRAAAERKARRERELQRDPRTVLSPEPEEEKPL